MSEARTVALQPGDDIRRAGDDVEELTFPLSGMVSLVVALTEGAAVEAATVGNEGVVGVEIALSERAASSWAISQVKGEALQLSAKAFLAHQAELPSLDQFIRRYAATLMRHMAQSAACNRYHPIQSRLAKWLLLTQDNVGDSFSLTQEFLAQMLGTHRPSVTIAAGRLQKSGLISYRRAGIEVLDRAGLEAASCECYRALQRIAD